MKHKNHYILVIILFYIFSCKKISCDNFDDRCYLFSKDSNIFINVYPRDCNISIQQQEDSIGCNDLKYYCIWKF